MNHAVKALRESTGLTQLELGQVMGVHPMTISKIERGLLKLSPWWEEAVRVMLAGVDGMRGDAPFVEWSHYLQRHGAIRTFLAMMNGRT